MSLRIMLVDDHKLLRDALRFFLEKESDLEIVAEAADGHEAIKLAAQLKPDIVIMDIGMKGIDGIETTQLLISQQAEVKVIALSGYTDWYYIDEMLHAGASAYISKASDATELIWAIRAVEKNEPYFCPETLMVLMTSTRQPQAVGNVLNESVLTPREREILCLLAQGKRSTEIARQLYIAVSTVDVHRRNIMNKLDLHNIAELTQYAIRTKLIEI
ncbi:MAG: response regulator transcription factor [Pseudomonadota bacterium]